MHQPLSCNVTLFGSHVQSADTSAAGLPPPRGCAQRGPSGGGTARDSGHLGISGHKRTEPHGVTHSVTLYPRGVRTCVSVPVKSGTKWNGKTRQGIKSFSAKSRARLRTVLLTKDGPSNWAMSALTLTVPGHEIMPVAEFQKLFHSWSVAVHRLGVLVVWRVELQQRGMPHVHAVCWGEVPEVNAEAGKLWFDLLANYETHDENGCGVCLRSDVRGAWKHAVKVDHGGMVESPDTMGGWSFTGIGQGWWRYLCDHTSKKKQAQLGWTGRHWGIINRKLIRENLASRHDLTDRQYALFLRHLRRLTRSLKWRGTRGASTWFTSPESAARLLSWAVAERP